jgi:hypothetical protein
MHIHQQWARSCYILTIPPQERELPWKQTLSCWRLSVLRLCPAERVMNRDQYSLNVDPDPDTEHVQRST